MIIEIIVIIPIMIPSQTLNKLNTNIDTLKRNKNNKVNPINIIIFFAIFDYFLALDETIKGILSPPE